MRNCQPDSRQHVKSFYFLNLSYYNFNCISAGKWNASKLEFVATENNHESQPLNRLHKANGRLTCIASLLNKNMPAISCYT